MPPSGRERVRLIFICSEQENGYFNPLSLRYWQPDRSFVAMPRPYARTQLWFRNNNAKKELKISLRID